MNEDEFKAVRHRYYKAGKLRLSILARMGFETTIGPNMLPVSHVEEKEILYTIKKKGLIDEFLRLLEALEKELEVK